MPLNKKFTNLYFMHNNVGCIFWITFKSFYFIMYTCTYKAALVSENVHFTRETLLKYICK